MDELVKVVVDDSQSTGALNRIAAAGARADTSINNLGQTIDRTTQATRSASGAAASNAASVQNQASAFQRLQSIVIGAASSFQRLASTTSGTLGSAFSRLQTVAGNAFSAIIAYANNAGGALNNFNRNLQQNQRSMDNLWRLASATAAANILGAMWDKATAGISAYIDRMTEVQRTMSMLTVVTPTGQQGEFDYIMKTADRYGVRLQSLANNYAKLAISAREANVPQETMRKLFEGTSIGARVMHMSVSQVDLTFQALTQMMSKGIVSTEELRRQFAERMPGAIHATAKELGVAYDELDKFVRDGKALSDKFIPYLANALINSFGKGIGPAASALDAELNRIHNSFDKFFKQVYDAGGDKGPAAAIRALNEKLNNPEIAKSFARWVDSISKEVTKFIQSITMEDIEKGANTFISVLKAIGDMAVFAAKSVKWLSENLGIVGGLLGAYMGAKIGFMVAGPPGMAVGAAIGGLGGAAGGMAMSGADTPGTQLQPSKTNSQMFLENQLRLQASGSTNGTQFNKADLDLLSGLPQMKIDALPELLPLKKVGPGTTLDDLLGGAAGGRKNGVGAKASAAAAERALEKQEDLMAKLHGLNKNFAEEWDTLNTVFNSAANKKQQFLPLEELISLQQELLEQQPFMKEIRKDEAISLKRQMKELDDYNKVQQNLLDDKKKMAEESMMDAQRMEDEAVAWQYAKDNAVDLATGIQMMAQARAQDNYESALAAGASGETLLALQRELEARNRILNQTKANNIRDTAEEEYKKLAKQQANFWDDTFQNADRAGRSIFQSLAQGGDDAFKQVGETIKTSIVDVLYQMTARKWVISIGTSIFGNGFADAAARAVGGGGAGGGAGGALSTAGGIGNMASLASGIGSFTTAGMLPGAMATTLTGSTSSLAMGLSGAWGAGGGMLSTLNAGASMLGSGSIMSGLGTIAGALGPIAIGIAALAAIFGKKATPHAGAASTYSEAGGLVSNADIYQSVGFRDPRTYNAGVEQVTANVAKAIGDTLNATAKAFGQTAGYEITTAFADDTSKDGAWGSLIIKQMGDAVLDWRDTQTSKWAPKEFADGEKGSAEYLAAVAASARDALVQAIGDVDWATDMLTALGESPTLEGLAQTVTQINAAKAAFVGFGQYMPTFASLADSAVSKLAQASGGVDALAGNMSVFVAEFFTEEERLKVATDNVTAELAKLGFEMPRTRDEFKALLQAQLALGDAGADTAAKLLQLSGAFASVTQAAGRAMDAASLERKDRLAAQRAQEKQAAEALQKQVEAYADGAEQFSTLRDSLLKAGDAAGLLAAVTERAFADPSGKYMNGRYELPRWESTDTAASFNYRYGEMQARMRQQLGDEASANALRIENVKGVLAAYSVEQMMSEYDPVTGPIKLAIQQGIVDASGDLGYAVRDAVQGAALYVAMADVRGRFTSNGPGLASIAAARASAADAGRASFDRDTGLYRIGGMSVEYGKALDNLEGAMSSGAITADVFERSVVALNEAMPGAAESVGTLEDLVAAVQGASYMVGQAGLNSIRYYFGSLSDMTAEFAKAAAEAQEPIAQTTAAIGRLNSAQYAFAESATAALQGFGGGGVAGEWMLKDAVVMKDINSAQLIAEAAGIASAAMTTADAAAAAEQLAQTSAFAESDAKGIRDASLMLDGVGKYNAEGFERAFIRISDALAKGSVTDAQYKALFDTALGIFEGVPEKTRELIDSMTYLRDAMRGFADGLLIDEQRTTLSAGATLAEMRRQYTQAFAGAATGDSESISKYQQLANTLLDKELYRTQAEYNAAFGSVYGDARQLEAIGAITVANGQGDEMVAELKDMNVKLNKRVEDLEQNLMAALAQIAKNTADTSRGIDQQIVMAEDTP